MAGTHPFLRRLRSLLKVVDDETLISLANRGLFRRAQKDLESASPTVMSVEENAAGENIVRVQMADAIVDVRELPTKCTCSCPATGTCRHILSVLLHLRDAPELADCDSPMQGALFDDGADTTETIGSLTPTVASALGPADLLGDLNDEALQAWAGKPAFRKALKALAAEPPVEIDATDVLLVRFPTRNITCRWIPGNGLLGMLCSCQAEDVCEHAVAAVLAYQVSLGKRQITVEQKSLTESSGAPRTRAEVLTSVGVLLRDMLLLGLARLSESTVQRLLTLAVSAHGVDLPRLERALKTLADEAGLGLRRDAQANSASLVAQAARVEALRSALEKNPSAALVGQHRTQYHDVGQITLVGLGAQRWRSQGGYHGVTVYFWDESRNDWASWNDTRPEGLPGFDPGRRFRTDGPWFGCDSPEEAARSVLRLSQASRNRQGRISGRSATRALVVEPSQPRAVPGAISDWSALAERAQRVFGGGLAERQEHAELVLLVPQAWGPPCYDPLRQELLRPLSDVVGRHVHLWLPFTPENEAGIEFLEQHSPTATFGLLGALRLVAGQVRVQPISLYADEKIIHLTLLDPKTRRGSGKRAKKARGAKAAARGVKPETERDEDLGADREEAAALPIAVTTPLGRILVTVQAELEAFVEGGLAAQRNVDLLRTAQKRLDALGLTAGARPLDSLLQALATAVRGGEAPAWNDAAGRLLRAYYVTHLAADYETISVACRGLS